MNSETDRLQQVLLERRRTGAVPAAFEAALAALQRELGPPSADCAQAKSGGQPLDYQLTWRFPSTTVHAQFLDFSPRSEERRVGNECVSTCSFRGEPSH